MNLKKNLHMKRNNKLEFCKGWLPGLLDYARDIDSYKVVMCFDRLPEENCRKIVDALNGDCELEGYTFEKDPEHLGLNTVSVYANGICDLDPEILVVDKKYVKKLLGLNI